jgi:hypothetical protein
VSCGACLLGDYGYGSGRDLEEDLNTSLSMAFF